MINIEHTETYGWKAAIRGMRNPMNSWDQSDSYWSFLEHPEFYNIGPKDLRLMRKLAEAGSDHGKFLRMITVTMDVTAPLYWWKEFDTYKVGTVANSCSTMHKIHAKEFTLDDFSHEHLSPVMKDQLTKLIKILNLIRRSYLKNSTKDLWWNMIQFLPSSYNQRRTVLLNYAVLRAIYHARKLHKLDEWRVFCAWIETLPYSELITGSETHVQHPTN